MNGKKLSKKWLYTFIGIAFVALATCTAALYYKEYIIATGTGYGTERKYGQQT